MESNSKTKSSKVVSLFPQTSVDGGGGNKGNGGDGGGTDEERLTKVEGQVSTIVSTLQIIQKDIADIRKRTGRLKSGVSLEQFLLYWGITLAALCGLYAFITPHLIKSEINNIDTTQITEEIKKTNGRFDLLIEKLNNTPQATEAHREVPKEKATRAK